ncbi:unnamed protein product [Discosporangium mesarthrocarpum]
MMVGLKAFTVLLSAIALLGSYTYVASQGICSDVYFGIPDSSNDVCCKAECGTCGGPGCALIPNTGGASDCCSQAITNSTLVCSETQGPPCILEPVPAPEGTCEGTDGVIGVRDPVEDACCPLVCGTCGGAGCGELPGTTPDECCSTNIIDAGQMCSVTGTSPCVVDEAVDSNSVCSNGIPGIEDFELDACCAPNCGQCGGEGCGTIAGTGGPDDCCSNRIVQSGALCDDTGAAPCVMTFDFEPSMCPNGFPGVASGNICCAEECGQCGGPGCGTIRGTNGASDCCATTIAISNVFCNTGISAPCIMPEGTYTDAPTAAPTMTPSFIMTEAPTAEGTPGSSSAPTGNFPPGVVPPPASERDISASGSLSLAVTAAGTAVAGALTVGWMMF